MTKSELIQRIAELNPHLYQRDVERIVSTIFDEIADALARGDRVELRRFRGVLRQGAGRAHWAQSADGRGGPSRREVDSHSSKRASNCASA